MLSLILLSLLLCPVLFYLMIYVKNTVRFFTLYFKLPSPKNILFLGHYSLVNADIVILFKKIRQYAKDHKPLYSLYFFKYIYAVNIVRTAECERVASLKTKSYEYKYLEKWLGNGLLTSNGSLWQSHRKILSSVFHFDILRDFLSVFNKRSEELIDIFAENEGTPINVLPLLSQYNLAVVVETTLGCKLNLEKESHAIYVDSIHTMVKLLVQRFVQPWHYYNIPYYLFTKNGRLEKQLLKNIHDYSMKIIKEKDSEMDKADSDVWQNENRYNAKKKLTTIELLLKYKRDGGDIDHIGIRDEVNTILLGGYDTSAHSLSYTLMLLAQHKDIQDRIYEELVDKLGESQEYLDMKFFASLNYMERVIKESLRLYPPLALIGKYVDEDIHTKDGIIIPKGSTSVVHIYDIHRDEEQWPEPEKFDPDRFLPENSVTRSPFAYIPFSAGPRNCIGQKYAMLQMKVVLCTIVKNFILEPVDTPHTLSLTSVMLLTPKNGSVLVKFKRRK